MIKNIKNITFLAVTASIISLSSEANAKFISPNEKFESKILSEKPTTEAKEYKRCPSELFKADKDDLADDYDSAIAKDPLESFNRGVYTVNSYIDKGVLKPTAKAYRFIVPTWGRERVSDLFQNLEEPRNFTNSVLQLDGKAAFTAAWRFVINSTIGILGTHDVASGFGLGLQEKDFSSTLAYYGVETGPYIVAPLLGPSTVRDLVSLAPDSAANPASYTEAGVAAAAKGADIVNTRDKIMDVTEDLERDSFDLYSSYKSGYLQNRKKSVEKAVERK